MTNNSDTESSDEWRTPRWFYAAMAELYGPFDLDAAATEENALAPQYFTRATDALSQPDWCGVDVDRVWCNPPYSKPNLADFTAMARREVLQGHVELVTCLIPMSTSAIWWHQNVESPEGRVRNVTTETGHPLGSRTLVQAELLDIEVLRVRGRLSFEGEARGSARFHSAVVTYSRPGLRSALAKLELRGRPVEFTEDQRAEVERLIAAGHSQSNACRLAGVNRRTWYRHKEKHHA